MKIRIEYPAAWLAILALCAVAWIVLWKFLLRPALRAMGIL